MTSIIGSVLSIVATLVGNAYMAKWIAALNLWLRTRADPQLKKMADDEYEAISSDWEALRKDRQGKGQG